MSAHAIVVFTGRSVERMLKEGGSSAWTLKPSHARRCEYVVCTRNSRAEFTTPGPEPHGSAFLVARIADIRPAPEPNDEGRYLIAFAEYSKIMVPNAWKGRNPVRYTTLEELGIDPVSLHWQPMPEAAPKEAPPRKLDGRSRESRGITIAEAKRALAEAFGVSEDAVEITIHG